MQGKGARKMKDALSSTVRRFGVLLFAIALSAGYGSADALAADRGKQLDCR